jgi:hypothetical protein
MMDPLSRIPNAQKGTSHEEQIRLRINCNPFDKNNDSTLGVECQPIPTLAFLSHLPHSTGFVHTDFPGIMPLTHPNVGDLAFAALAIQLGLSCLFDMR